MSKEVRMKIAYLRAENKKLPATMSLVAKSEWPQSLALLTEKPDAVFRSSQYLVQVFPEKDGAVRLTVSRTMMNESGDWLDGFTWDDLMRVKGQCGYGDLWAVEIFPPADQVVNVANMRHLWLLKDAPPYAWVARDRAPGPGAAKAGALAGGAKDF